MLKKNIIISALALTMCTSALLASCGVNDNTTNDNSGKETTVETTKKATNDNVVGEIGSDVGDMAGDVINGAGNIVSDVVDDDNREDATHGTEAEKDSGANENAKHRRAPYGK